MNAVARVGLAEMLVAGLNRFVEVLVGMGYGLLVVVIGAAVFFRYVVNDSIVWAEELARYLFVWITFLGAALGVGRNVHIGVDVISGRLHGRMQQLLTLATYLAIAAFLIVLLYCGLELSLFGLRSSSMLLGIPMFFVYMAVPIGSFVMLANVSMQLIVLFTKGMDRNEGERN